MPSHTRIDPALGPPQALPALPPGHRLPGFELQGELEADGIVDDCRTYRAWDLALQRPVVIAEYLPSAWARRGDDGEVAPATPERAPGYAAGLDHFIEQTRGLAAAEPPSLVGVLHLLLAQGSAYRVMPHYAGQRLLQLRHRMPGPPDEDALRDLLDELLAALQAIHAAGAVHGAVHPGRILVLGNERSLLLAPRTGVATVADPYAPPELQPGGPAGLIGPWSDCHALAQVARFCITGLDPVAHPEAAMRPLLGWVDELSEAHRAMHYTPALLRVLDLAASADIARRPQSAAEFRDWLRRAPAALAQPAPGPRLDGPPGSADQAAARAVQSVIAALPPRAPAAERIELPPTFQRPTPRPAPEANPESVLTAQAAPELEKAPPIAAAPARPRAPMAVLASVAALALAAVLSWVWWLPSEPEEARSAAPAPAPAPALAARPAEATPPPPPAVAVTDFNALPAPAAGPASVPAPVPEAAAPAAPALATRPVSAPPPAVAAAPAPKPSRPAATAARATPAASRRVQSPRERCGERTPFALYRCMQRECAVPAQRQHPQCVELRRTDSVQ